MLENPRRQLMLVLLVTVGAVVALAALPINRGLDLSGGVQIIYEVNPEIAKRDGLIPAGASAEEIDQVMEDTVEVLAERIDPKGTTEALVTRHGDYGILIELPQMTEAETRAIESRIENLGRLEFRMVATHKYRGEDENGVVTFDPAEEMRRLNAWLDADGGANRQMVAEKPEAIRVFNGLTPDATPLPGPAAGDALQWYPRQIRPTLDDPSTWEASYAGYSENPLNVVPVYTPEQYAAGPQAEGAPEFLVELVPINMHEEFFTGEDLDAGATKPTIDDFGRPAIGYRMNDASMTAYADWSQEHVNEASAIILNGFVESAPEFKGRILGDAQISGNFTQSEVNELVKTLRAGSLKVKPIRQSYREIGATLGEHSIRLAFISIAIGAALILGFIIAYYRFAGIVAFAALGLNILLILALVALLRATLTLPGLAGLVLTMGMAIDSNILIYERIREELDRGKDLVQACRMGFDRAISAILDSNLTTFIAGVVLYNFGVGPIRGFAVTLMIGIVTTLFTAYFVSRLVFHYLIEFKLLKSFRVSGWLQNPSFDFLGWRRPAFAITAVLIVGSIVAFAIVPGGRKYAIDFTGGANLIVSLKEPVPADEIRDAFETDGRFHELFDAAIVNTYGDVEEGRARQFSIRLKVDDEMRARIEREKAADPEGYEPPYVREVRRVLGDLLVASAFSDVKVSKHAFNDNLAFAEMDLHFAQDVRTDSVREALRSLAAEVVVTPEPDPEATVARNFEVQWDVAAGTTEEMLFPQLQDRLKGVEGPNGEVVALSSPIPEQAEIGGRMVGELRNAAVTAMFLALFGIVMYIRVRFHEYKFGIAAIAAVLHDVIVALGAVVLFNAFGLVDAEIDLAMIAAFLTIVGYSINDTIVIFDRVRENLSEQLRLGERVDRKALLNLSLNQTLSRTILTTATTMAVIVTQFVVNYHGGTALEGFSFALIVGLVSGTYSTVFIASPIVLWLWRREGVDTLGPPPAVTHEVGRPEPARTAT